MICLKKQRNSMLPTKLMKIAFIVCIGTALQGCMQYQLKKGPQNAAAHDMKLTQTLAISKETLLSPKDSSSIAVTEDSIPKRYRLVRNDGKSWNYDYLYKLGDYYYYKVTAIPGSGKTHRMRTNGTIVSYSNTSYPFHLAPKPEDRCKFVLGNCKYLEDNGSISEIFNSYDDGVWTTSRDLKSLGVGTRITRSVYNKSGFELFSSTAYSRDPGSYTFYYIEQLPLN